MNEFISAMTKLEDLTKEDNVMKKLCKFIRNNPDTIEKLEFLTKIVAVIHISIEPIIKSCETEAQRKLISRDFADFLFKYLKKNRIIKTEVFEENFKKIQLNEIIRVQFDRINPYIDTTDVDRMMEKKDFIDIFDEIYEVSIKPHIEDFILDYKNIIFGRAANVQDASYERLTPNPAYINNNRWNPKDRFYSYLGINRKNNGENLVSTCLEEIRCNDASYYTFCKFKLIPDKPIEILDLSLLYYESGNLETYISNYEKEGAQKIIRNYNDGKIDSIDNIEKDIHKVTQNFKDDFEIKLAKELLCFIIEVIFVPLDSDEDMSEDLKTKAYASFHKLALWLEARFHGVIYPSTRMKLINDTGECCVLFDHKLAVPVLGSKVTGIKSN